MIKSVLKLQKFLNRIPEINSGGCGIAALYFSNLLDTLNINHKIVYGYYGSEYRCEQGKMALKNGEVIPTPTHVYIRVHSKERRLPQCFDASGEIDSRIYRKTIVNKENLIRTLNECGWNSDFKRDKHIERIDEFYNKLIKNTSDLNA